MRLGESTAEAVAGVLEMFAAGQGRASASVAVVPGDANPLDGLPVPAVATSVSYVDGVTGGNVFVMTLDGARRLAAAMMGMEQPEDPDARRAVRARAVRRRRGDEPDDGLGGRARPPSVLGTEVEIGAAGDQARFSAPARGRRRVPARRRTPSARRSRSAASRAGSSSSSRTRSSSA